jgi:hypothetical protein
VLDRIDSANVDLYTVNGNISYDGAIREKGLYRLTTHNGMIAMPIPDKTNATLTVRTYNGSFRSTFPLAGDDAQRRNKRFTVTLGNGSAHLELESFGGAIALRRPGDPRPETERKRRSDKEKEKEKEKGNLGAFMLGPLDHVGIQAEVERAMAEAQPEIDRAVAEAMADAQPDIDAAVAEAMAELHDAMRFARPMPRPNPAPRPRPQAAPRPFFR